MSRLFLGIFIMLFSIYSWAIPENKTTDRQQQSTQDKRGTPEFPFSIKIIPTDKTSEQSKQEEEDRAYKRSVEEQTIKLTEQIKNFTGALVLVGIVQAFIFVFQLIVFGQQATRLRETVDLSRQEFISTHRPRMRIKHVWLSEDIQAGEPIKINLVSVNTGDTEARITRFDVVTHAIPKFRHPPNNPFNGRNGFPIDRMLPSGVTLDHLPREAGYVNLAEIGDIRNGSMWLYCFAYVEYLDASDLPRKTSCCRVLRPSPREALSVIDGIFIKPEKESEYEYAD